jgi:hypothetical protein
MLGLWINFAIGESAGYQPLRCVTKKQKSPEGLG